MEGCGQIAALVWRDATSDSEGDMQRIVVAPCSPFSVSRDLMKEAGFLATK